MDINSAVFRIGSRQNVAPTGPALVQGGHVDVIASTCYNTRNCEPLFNAQINAIDLIVVLHVFTDFMYCAAICCRVSFSST